MGAVGLLLPARRALPLLKLLEGAPLVVMDGYYGLAKALSHKRLKLIFDLRLLLLEIVRLEDRRSRL